MNTETGNLAKVQYSYTIYLIQLVFEQESRKEQRKNNEVTGFKIGKHQTREQKLCKEINKFLMSLEIMNRY